MQQTDSQEGVFDYYIGNDSVGVGDQVVGESQPVVVAAPGGENNQIGDTNNRLHPAHAEKVVGGAPADNFQQISPPTQNVNCNITAVFDGSKQFSPPNQGKDRKYNFYRIFIEFL